jgi:hypothetical protein
MIAVHGPQWVYLFKSQTNKTHLMCFVTLTFELIIDNAHNEQNKAGVFLFQILDKTALNNF